MKNSQHRLAVRTHDEQASPEAANVLEDRPAGVFRRRKDMWDRGDFMIGQILHSEVGMPRCIKSVAVHRDDMHPHLAPLRDAG